MADQEEKGGVEISMGDACGPISRDTEIESAIDRYSQLLLANPTAAGFYNLGLLYFQKEMFDHAGGAFAKALELKPNMPEALINLGGIAFTKGDYEQAIELNLQALEFEPKSVFAKRNLAIALIRFNDEKYLGKAIKHLQDVLDEEPKDAIALYFMAVARNAVGETEEAKRLLREAIKRGYEAEKEFLKILDE